MHDKHRRMVAGYLARYADPDAVAIAAAVPGHYAAAVVIPARDESPEILPRMAAALAGRDALVVVIVNADDASPSEVHGANATLLQALRGAGRVRRVGDAVDLVTTDAGNAWLVLDRAQPGHRLPTGQGVGGARRLGCDLVLSLVARGVVARSVIDTTDADVRLPVDYFDADLGDAVAMTRPFVHVPQGDTEVDVATALYELTLRYYVAALADAGSPWAMHTIGSCLSVSATAYATVRGLPVRAAGEDFYLLAKVAKLGTVVRGRGRAIEIASRDSARVPFGTGPAVASLVARRREGLPVLTYAPDSFAAVARTLVGLRAWVTEPSSAPPSAVIMAQGPDDDRLAGALTDLAIDRRLMAAMRGAPTVAHRLRRAHEWLDAFGTLKLIHRLRDRGHAAVPWRRALAAVTDTPLASHGTDALPQLQSISAQLASDELALSAAGLG